MDEIKLWNQALRAYRAQDWDQAELTLMNLQRIKPRYLYDLYIKRVEHLRKEPPGENWDGVTIFETK
jgi:adenylate cyclase